MDRQTLIARIRATRSLLCVGLDTEPGRVPEPFRRESDPVGAYNRAIVEATHDLTVAYKFNLAFYEALGAAGWESLERTLEAMPKDVFLIADAKRGDIGNTARKYAEAFFDRLGFDAVTVAPYMGRDAVTPFLGRPGKWAIVLSVTSNEGALDFQFLDVNGGPDRLFEVVVDQVATWGSSDDTMFVAGATRPEVLAEVRRRVPDHFLLVPGVGAQGGDLDQVLDVGLNQDGGLLINSSRGILYAGTGSDALPAARRAALELQQAMEAAMRVKGVV
ncbi:MAG: orotidine-5'-phosphate decarboxylase [Flavobacteriales bacterium]